MKKVLLKVVVITVILIEFVLTYIDKKEISEVLKIENTVILGVIALSI